MSLNNNNNSLCPPSCLLLGEGKTNRKCLLWALISDCLQPSSSHWKVPKSDILKTEPSPFKSLISSNPPNLHLKLCAWKKMFSPRKRVKGERLILVLAGRELVWKLKAGAGCPWKGMKLSHVQRSVHPPQQGIWSQLCLQTPKRKDRTGLQTTGTWKDWDIRPNAWDLLDTA